MYFPYQKLLPIFLAFAVLIAIPIAAIEEGGDWLQWGQNPMHTGFTHALPQSLNVNLFDILYDPFVAQERALEADELLAHFQTPLVDRDGNVFMEFKSGAFDSSNLTYSTQVWSEKKMFFDRGQTYLAWSYQTDWKPAGFLYDYWEPVFHAAISGPYIYLPGAGGSIWQLRHLHGEVVNRIDPFGDVV